MRPWRQALLPFLLFSLLLSACRLLPTPVGKLDSARNDEQGHREALLHEGQEYAAAAGKALAKDKTPSQESQAAANLLNRANVAFGVSLGALLPSQDAKLDELVAKLTSTNAEIQAQGTKLLEARSASTARIAQDLEEAREHTKKLEAQVAIYAAERDAVARKWEKAMWLLRLGIGGWVFVAFVLPLLARAFPGIGAVATVGHAIVAPFAAAAVSKTKQVLGDVVSGVEDVRAALKKAGSLTKAEMDEKLSEWVTEADGTAAAVDAVRRERKLIS